MLVCRGDVAVRMCLPIDAAVALARSYGDGVHRSIPAPGPGVDSPPEPRPKGPRKGERGGGAGGGERPQSRTKPV